MPLIPSKKLIMFCSQFRLSQVSLEGTQDCLCDSVCLARGLNLSDEPIRIIIKTVSGSSNIDSMVHYVSLVDGNNVTHTVKALQVKNISDSLTP